MKKKLLLAGLLTVAATGVMAQVKVDSLNTQSTNQLGLTMSSYAYDESSLGVKMEATNIGVEYLSTYAFKNNWFLLGEFDYNNGSVKYTGSGTASGIAQYYYNLKGAVGYDFAFDSFVVSPYIGLGYRFLDQSLGGVRTSTGAIGYDRKSTYNYIPIGAIHRFAVKDNKAKIETTLEYDYLISGNQYSGLSTAGLPNQNNKQTSGYGLNLTILYKQDNWGFGPYYKYWNIDKSQTNTFDSGGSTWTVYEPQNTTNEYGVKLTYSF
jgi:outer membrane protein W